MDHARCLHARTKKDRALCRRLRTRLCPEEMWVLEEVDLVDWDDVSHLCPEDY